MTNEQKIKNMSTEELVNFLKRMTPSCYDCHFIWTCEKNKSCKENIKQWLMQEAQYDT